jgi:hypothetical protein
MRSIGFSKNKLLVDTVDSARLALCPTQQLRQHITMPRLKKMKVLRNTKVPRCPILAKISLRVEFHPAVLGIF